MNKIFKVIWSKSKQCYIVVSEMAKNHSGKKKIVVASILAAMAVGVGNVVSAAPGGTVSLAGGSAPTDGSIAIGVNSLGKGTSFPQGGVQTVDPSIAIGAGARAEGNSSLSIGLGAKIDKKSYAIAIGRHTEVTGDYGVGIGYNVRSVQDGTAVGEQARSKKQGATALGVSSRGYSQGGVAIGWQSLAGANVYTAGVPGSDINKDNETDITNYGKWGDVAIGLRAMATGGNATAVGRSANATEANAIAIGGGDGNAYNDNVEHTIASGEKAIAIGYKALASDKSATSIGTDAQASQARATAIGYEVRAVGKNAVAIGSSGENSSRKLNSAGENAVAIGTAAQANNLGSTAIGNLALAGNNNAVALGTSAEGTGESSTAVGKSAKAKKSDAIALGTDTEASEERAVAIGKGATAEKVDTVALGTSATSGGTRGVAIGNDAAAQEVDTIAIGSGAKAVQASDNAFGNGANASGGGSTAVGYMVNTTGNLAFGAGSNSNVSGAAAVGIGYKVTASGNRAISIGNDSDNGVIQTTASGEKSIAIGSAVQSTGSASVAIGKGAISSQENAFAAGTEAKAQAKDTVAIGSGVTASGLQSISIGSTFNNRANQATGIASVAIGSGAQSTGDGSVALGRNVQALEKYTTAVGMNITASDSASASTILGYNSSTKANQSVNIGSTNTTEKSAQYSTAIGYQINVSGKNAIGIGSSDDNKNVVASADNATAIGTSAQATASSAMALGRNANATLAHSVALGEDSTTTAADGAAKKAYLTNESTNNSGNGVISIGNKRNASDAGTITRRIVGVAGGTDDYDAVNVKQLKALESNEWLLRTQNVGDANPTDATPQTVNGQTKKRVTLKGSDNISISNTNGVVTLGVTNVVKTVTSGNTAALTVNTNTNTGAVTITPNIASSVGAAGEDNKLVTSGKVKTALDAKIDKTAEVHIKSGDYTVNSDGTASLIQQNGNNQDQSTRVTIKDIAKKSVVDNLTTTVNTHTTQIGDLTAEVGKKANQSDLNDLKLKAITFKGDDNQGVARTLDTTLTVKGGANYTSTTENTNIRVEKDGANGANGLLVKLSDKLSGMKEIAGTGEQDLVIKNGNTTVTVKAPANGDTGTVDFGKAKVVASNLDASIKYRANDEGAANAKSVKLADGFNFVASKDATTTADGPKSGLAITTEANGKVTFGLDKATREKVDNAADKNLSNLSDAGTNKVKELAKTAAQDAVKVAAGTNTSVTTDTTTTTGVTTYKVNANDTTVAVTGDGLAITGGDLGTDKVRKYSLDLSAATKGKLAAVGNLATNVIGGTTIGTDGTVTGPIFSITNAEGTAENAGTIKEAIEKLDAANKGQNTKISETAGKVTALEGKVTNLGDKVTNNYNDLSNKITQAGTNVTNALTEKGLNFTGNDTTATVHRDLGTTLTIKGAENFTRAATETNNIKVVKNGDALDVKLAENLTNMKEISGDGTSDLVIKNGNTKVTVKAPTNGDKGTVDFGDAKVIAKNLDASIAYKSNQDTAKKTVKLQDGFNFNAATDATTTAEGPKSGLTITTGDNGVVTFGLDKATRSTIDNAADKNLSNLSDTGKDKVKELAKGAAQDAVKVANGINTTVEKDTATAGVTTYKVNANDTTVAVTGNGLAITGGELGTDKVRKYSLDLSAATKGKLAAVGNLATNVIGGTTIAADGTVTGPTFSITKADGTAENAGTIKEAIEKLDAANKGQNTKISDTADKVTKLATALGGGAKVENGTFTGPTYNITKADGSGTETVSNVGDAISKLDNRITTANGTLVTKGLDFTGNDTTDAGKVHRDLGTTLIIKGAENFTRAATETNNIKVVKNGDALDVKLAGNLANMKEISGDGTSDLVIKNGNTKVTVKAPANGDKGTVDFGDAKVIAKNLDASIAYKSNQDTAKKTVKLQDGFNFTAATDASTTAEGPKSGLAITTGANGEVTFGLDKATRSTIDNAADKNLSNLSETGKNTVKELAKGAAQDAVKVANGINTTVTTDTATTGVTTYKVNANDTTVAANADTLAISGGELGTDKVRKYTLDLSAATKGKLAAVGNLATNVIGGTTVNADGTVVGPTFSITKADGSNETANTLKDAIDKLNTTNAGQNTKISETAGKVTTLEGKVDGIVDKGMTFAGDNATADKVTRKLGETLNIHGQNNITVKKDATAEDTLNVKLASDLKNITSITNADADGKLGSKITLGADGVSIVNTAAGQDGAAGTTKTVTIGKDGINAGGMKITNVAEAKDNGDAANKKYVDDAITNLGNIVSGNATLNFAGNVTKDGQNQDTAKLGLSLATGTLHVNGANNEITTTAKGDTITVGLAETVKAQLAKVGDTSSNGRDGKDGTSGATGLTGKDGLNDKTLTDKVNALRNGEAGSVVYTDENGARLVKAKDGEYYKAADVDKDGNVLNGATPASTVEARLVNPKGETTVPTKLSNIADGKVAEGSKDAVNGGQLNTVKSDLATALGGGAKVENGAFTGPTYNITKDDGSNTKEEVKNVGDAISKLDGRINNANTTLANKGLDFTGNDTTAKVHRNLGETLTIKGAENFTRTATEANNIKVVKTDNDLDVKLAENLGNIKSISNATGAGKPGSTITLGADGVSIVNTAAGADGAAGETKTVTIGKDGINAGGMKITNVGKATDNGDAANKEYVDDAIKNLNTTVTNNANLRYAGDTNVGAAADADHLNLPLATGTLKVAGTADQIKTVANNGTITLSLAEKVTNKLDKLGDTAADGRDGKAANGQAGDAGNAGDKGATGKDGLNGTNLTDKVNALRNGEAGSVVYTDENGERLVKANNGNYYKTTDVDKTGNVVNNAQPATTVEARVVNPDGTTTGGTTKLSNIADGKVAANSKDAVNGGQLHTAKSEIGAIIGGTIINENGKITGPTFSITNEEGTAENAGTIKEAIEKLDAANKGQNTKISETAGKVTTLEGKVDGIVDKGMTFAGDDATADKVTRKLGETLNIHGQNNITVKKDATAEDTLNVKLASDLKNITSITNADADGKPGSKITLGADGVSIANTAAGADGAAGETKTVTIGKDGINAGGMKITNVAKATDNGDAANKEYVDEAIKNLNTTVTNNANLRYAGDTNEGAATGADHLNLPLATGTLKVAGTADQIKTVANNGTITLSLDEKVTDKLAKLGDAASNGRDGKDGTSGAQGLTGKDGLNDKTLTDKVNALRNGEAGSVVYTNDAGDRVVKAKDGKYYKADEVKADGTVKTAEENNGKVPEEVKTPQARVVNPNGKTTVPTTLSNVADGKVAADSKEAVNGGQLNTVKSDLATALGGGAKVENGTFTGPTYNITKDDGTGTEAVKNVGDAISKLDGRINNANTALANKGLDFTGNDTTAKVHRNLGETLTIKGADNFTRTATETNNIKVVKTDNDLDVKLAENLGNIKSISNTTGEGKPGSTITLGADGVSIANIAAGADGAAGETKTVTIGKDGINAGGMTITNVGEAKAEGDAANKKYVDDAINNLNTTVTNNANLRYAGDTNEGAVNGEDHLNLPLATGTLKVAGTADQIKTVANNGTITLSLDEKVTNKLNKLGDTASNGRDGANGLTGKDGLNDKTLTEKVNALRNGEAGTVVYTDDAGERLVKANDGKYYHKDDLKADGTPKTADENNGTAPKAVDNPQARVVNPNGDAKAPTTLSNIADGKVAEGSKDAVNGGQLHTVKSDLATALGGGAKVENGVFTGPTYSVTKADGTGTETASNVGEAISKLDTRITTANGALVTKGLDFTGNDTTAKVHRNLGETLTIKGAENFTRTATETNNIKVVKTGNDLDVKLAENLGNMKEIAGNGTDDLVIKNGDATITLKPKKDAEGTNPATPATVDFGDTKVVASNLDASIKYRANDEGAANAKSVKLADGFNFVASTVTDTATEGPKSGLAIKAEDNGKVTFGLDKATREKVDNAADKNLSNLSQDGKDKVKELAGEAAKAAVTVADGINTTVTTDTTTTAGVTTYKVNANDTTVAVNADSLAISGGTPDATTKVRAYTLDLSDTVKAKLNAINNVGDTASNGRDGVNGTSGATGLTGADGLNDKTLTEKVNALRNGEAGSVVYTDENGVRLVKAKDGEYYKAADVDKDGNVLNGAKPASTVEARLVNPKGETTVPTKLSNIADGKVAAGSKDAVNGGQLNTVKTDLASALGGGAKVENGTFTGPIYNITKDDGTGTEAVKNVGDAISKLDGRINNANTALANKGLDFTGNDTTDAGKVHRNLGETLTIKGAENFTRAATETNNIKVVKTDNDLDVKLAENLGNIKEIAGNGKDDLVIKNGDATITLKPKKEAEGTNPATPATVDFGNTKVVAPNLEASITYRANSAEDADAKTVTLQKGLNFVSGDGTAATAEAAKAGITIAADKDGKVVFGLNEATRNAIDNAADKNLSNLSQEGKDKVADLAKTAAREAVKVAGGNNVTVTPETKDGVTTYTVNGRDTTVKAADKGSVSVTGGTLNANGEREYTVDLTADAKAELGKISDLNTRLGSAEGKITTLQGDMTKAKDDIAANTKAIEANKEAIATNKNAIADNAKNIAANTKDIDANKQGIAENKEKIGENAKAIAKHAEDIKKNVEDIKKNTEDIKKNAQDIKDNKDAIKANTDRIHTVETRVDTAEGKIAANEKAIKDNASAIQSNTKAIGTNTTAIAKNASDITKANKEIESLKGNSATKDLSNLTNTGKDTITKLIDVKGENGITVTPSTNTESRVKTFTAKLNDTVTFGSGDKKITVDGTTGTVTSKAVAADTVKANTVNAKTVQLGDSTGTNTTVTADGIAVTTKNLDGTTSKVEIKNGTVSGLTNTKWDPAKVVTDADRGVVATQGQVKDVTDTLARGRVFVGDTGKTVTVGLGDTLAIKGGSTKALTEDNIGVVSTEAKDGKPATMTVKLAKDVKMKDGSTSYDYYLPEVKTNPDGSKEIVKNADGSVKYQLGKDGNPIRLVTTTVNGEGITIAPVKGLDKPTVSLTADGLDNGGNQIHNVAAGTANTDAATVGQVRAAAHALNNRVNEAGAHAAALAAMNPLSYDPLKKSQVMAGYGAYKGSNALALGVAHYANEDTLFNVGVSVGNGENMVNAGVTYRFGGEDSMIPERYKGGPISSVYVMQDEITALKAENARKDAENAKKEAENEEMKAQIKMLIERVTMLEAKK